MNGNNEGIVDIEKIRFLCLEIQTLDENVKKSLNRFDNLTDEIMSYYKGDVSSIYSNKKNNFKLSYNNIIDNISSYIDDYNLVVKKFRELDNTVSNNIVFDDFKM